MNKKTALVFTGIFLFLFVFNWFSPLSFGDDYVYSFIWTGQSLYEPLPESARRVASWGDLLDSQWLHYFTWSGRTVAHFLAQFFLWKGKTTFNVINTFVSILLICEIYWCIYKGKISLTFSYSAIICIFILLWACTPGFGVIFFWVTGACNYLWTNVILTGFLIAYIQKYYGNEKSVSYCRAFAVIMFLYGIVAGWTNENSVCWILLLLLLFTYICIKKNYFEFWMLTGWAGLLTGYGFLMFAPGNMVRLSAEQPEWNIVNIIGENFSVLVLILLFQFFLWYFLLRSLYIISNLRIDNNLIRKEVCLVKVLSIISFLMTAVMLFSPSFPARSGFSGLLFLIIAVGIMLRIQNDYNLVIIRENAKKLMFCVGVLFFVVTAGFTFRNYYCSYQQVECLIESVRRMDKEQKRHIISVDKIKPPSEHEDLYTTLHLLRYDISENEREWKNVALARYYHVKGIRSKKKQIEKPTF